MPYIEMKSLSSGRQVNASRSSESFSVGVIRFVFHVVFVVLLLAGCPFNGPLSGTKYPTRAASPIQNASTPKSSLPFSKHRSCALLCAVVRRF